MRVQISDAIRLSNFVNTNINNKVGFPFSFMGLVHVKMREMPNISLFIYVLHTSSFGDFVFNMINHPGDLL